MPSHTDKDRRKKARGTEEDQLKHISLLKQFESRNISPTWYWGVGTSITIINRGLEAQLKAKPARLPPKPETAIGRGFQKAGEAYQKFERTVLEPGAAVLSAGAFELIGGEQGFEKIAREERRKGAGPLQSLTTAYRQTDMPWGVKGALQEVVNPINALPGVGFVSGKVVKQAVKSGIRAVPKATQAVKQAVKEDITEAVGIIKGAKVESPIRSAEAAGKVPDDILAPQIGDDVVFEGADGTPFSGKVTGHGVITVGGVRKPYYTVQSAAGEPINLPTEAVRLKTARLPAAAETVTPPPRVAEAAGEDLAFEAEAVFDKLSGYKRPNSRNAGRLLDDLSGKGVDVEESKSLLDDYRDLQRGDYDDAAEFAEDRASAWDDFLNSVDEIDTEVLEEVADLAPAARVVERAVPEQAAPVIAEPPKPITVAPRVAEAAGKGKLDSIFLPGESGLSVNQAFARAKEQGLVKTKQDFQNLLRKELNEGIIDAGSGTTGMKPTLKGLVPLELSPVDSVRRVIPEAAGKVPDPAAQTATIGRSITGQFNEGLNARSAFEGGEVRPGLGYSWRSMGPAEYKKIIEGKSFGGPAKRGGYWAWFPSYSSNLKGTPKRTKYLVEVEIPSSGEALTRKGTLGDVRAVWKHEGKDWIPEPFPSAARPTVATVTPAPPVSAAAPTPPVTPRVTKPAKPLPPPVTPQAAAASAKTLRALAADKTAPLAEREAAREIAEAKVASERIQAASQGAPPPKRPPGTPQGADMGTPPPTNTYQALDDAFEMPSWENPSQAAFRKFEGSRNLVSLEAQETIFQGNRQLRRLGVTEKELASLKTKYPKGFEGWTKGQIRRHLTEQGADAATIQATVSQVIPPTGDIVDLMKVLHGDLPVEALSKRMRPIYSDIDPMRLLEQDEMLGFLKNVIDDKDFGFLALDAEHFAGKIMATPHYLQRLWKPTKSIEAPSGTVAGRLGTTPNIAKSRVDMTFTEMLEEGFQPGTLNPYAAVAKRRITGVTYRETVILANRLRARGLVLTRNEAPEGWRVPKIGSAFEGRSLPDPNVPGGVIETAPLYVEPRTATMLENVFGVPLDFPHIQTIRKWSNAAKRLKLAGSAFQHMDFALRTAGVAFTPTAIARGAPLRFPSLAARLIQVSIMPGPRNTLRQTLLANKPMYKDFAISPRMLIEEGWGIQGDITLIRREFTDFLSSPEVTGIVPVDAVRKAMKFWEDGLFDGVYREAQWWSLREFIIPWIRRTRPNATPRQVAAEAAEAVNIMFSTLGTWQTVIQDRTLREFLGTVAFSSNENESLLRSFFRATSLPEPIRKALPGAIQRGPLGPSPNAGMFREHYAGMFISFAIIANVINYAATGKVLPLESYSPIKFNDPYAPFKVGYSNKFMSPQVPFIKGRNGQPVYVDIVGQMDTALRWAQNPAEAIAARTNVFPRAIWNQVKNETFFGEQLGSIPRRAVQAAVDVLAPIGATQLLGAAREAIPAIQGVVPGMEGRLGVSGQLVQAGGINLRGQGTVDMLDSLSRDTFSSPYSVLEPIEREVVRNIAFQALSDRQRESLARGDENSRYYADLDSLDDERWQLELALLSKIKDGTYRPRRDRFKIIDEYSAIQDFYFGGRAQLNKTYKKFQDDSEPDKSNPDKEALRLWYAAFDESKVLESGQISIKPDFDKLEILQNQVLASHPNSRGYIIRNTNRTEHPEGLIALLSQATQQRIKVSRKAREAFLKKRLKGKTLPDVRRPTRAQPFQPPSPGSVPVPVTDTLVGQLGQR